MNNKITRDLNTLLTQEKVNPFLLKCDIIENNGVIVTVNQFKGNQFWIIDRIIHDYLTTQYEYNDIQSSVLATTITYTARFDFAADDIEKKTEMLIREYIKDITSLSVKGACKDLGIDSSNYFAGKVPLDALKSIQTYIENSVDAASNKLSNRGKHDKKEDRKARL